MGEVAELLGRPPLPPRWALGFLQSTRHFDDTAELRRLPRTIRDKRIPCDAPIYLSTERPLDELTLQIYPHATSRFVLYEDDGRTNAYRRGVYALTSIVCTAEPARISVRVDAPSVDRSVVPPGRRYLLRLRVERPAAVAAERGGELPHTASDTGRPSWWLDDAGFLCIRPPEGIALSVTVTRATTRS